MCAGCNSCFYMEAGRIILLILAFPESLPQVDTSCICINPPASLRPADRGLKAECTILLVATMEGWPSCVFPFQIHEKKIPSAFSHPKRFSGEPL